MGWLEFIAAFGVFFLTHSVPLRPPVRPWLREKLGSRGFTMVYSLVSLAVLGWLIGAAQRAPYFQLWAWAPWQNWVVLIAMGFVCLIFAAAIGRPNPFSFGGWRNDRFDPARPGIVRFMRHPILVALAIWSAAHLVANGNLAHVLLFGSFALFAVLGQALLDRRKRAELGAEWDRLRAAMTSEPVSFKSAGSPEAFLRPAAALAVYAALLAAHPILFGVSPLPWAT